MFWHLKPLHVEARGYEVAGGYEEKRPYRSIVNVSILGGGGQAYLGAAMLKDGRPLSRGDVAELGRQLRAQHGVGSILIERRGRLVPWDIAAALDGTGPLTRPSEP